MTKASLFALCATALLLGCSGSKGGATKPPSSAGGAGEESQVALGGKLYGQHCASCHGAGGEGGDKGPAVVGKAALPLDPPASAKARTAKFHSAKDVADFVVKTMPADAPGSLTPAEYLAVLAFDLNANGIDMTGKKLEMANLADFVIHP